MADFVTWICAAEPALGLPEGAFLDAFGRNTENSNMLALEASPLVEPIKRIAERGAWQGTATDLLGQLVAEQLNDYVGVQRSYPKNPRLLSKELRRLVLSLAQIGITIELTKTPGANSERIISIRIG